jgi:ADP-heptose:LPS heptosyltransferase
MKLLIINIGWLGDSILAGSFAENCKKNGYSQVDMLVGLPQTLALLQANPFIDNVYQSANLGAYPEIPSSIDLQIYDRVYSTDHLKFKERPLDTFNRTFNLQNLDYAFKLNVPEVDFEFENTKPRLAFQVDWHLRSWGPGESKRDPEAIISKLSEKYDVYLIGDNSHFNIDKNTANNFAGQCSLIKQCDLFFGYPGGMHWMASGVGTPTVTTTEFITRHYINNGEYTPTDFESFKEQFMVHASKHFIEPHILLEPEVSDEFIIDFLLKYKI